MDLIKLYNAARQKIDLGTIEVSFNDLQGFQCLTLRWRATISPGDELGLDQNFDAARFVDEEITALQFAGDVLRQIQERFERAGH